MRFPPLKALVAVKRRNTDKIVLVHGRVALYSRRSEVIFVKALNWFD